MKTIKDVLTTIERRLARNWLVVGSSTSAWPATFVLGLPHENDEFVIEELFREAANWEAWAAKHSAELEYRQRTFRGSTWRLPSHVVVNSSQQAARLVGGKWVELLETSSWRRRLIDEQFGVPDDDFNLLLRQCARFTDEDFELLLCVANWFLENPNSGLTSRQVPVPGIHAKWITSRVRPLKLLLGVDDLGLVESRPRQVNFTYLDPEHLADGGRLHDSVVVDTPMTPAYFPEVVVISENLDTAVLFPQLPRAISVQGQGLPGPDKISRVEWIAGASRLFYWGDLDAQGFEILDTYRAYGLTVSSILMDTQTMNTYAKFRSTRDPKGHTLTPMPRRQLNHLNKSEKVVYHSLTERVARVPLRIEQERIPIQVALDEIISRLGD